MITEKEILDMGEKGLKINLIKELRTVSGLGLAQCKDLIEKACGPWGTPTAFVFNSEVLLSVFAPYIKTPEQIEQERLDKIEQARILKEQAENSKRQYQETMRNNMLKGIEIAFDKFKQLGFDTPFDAVTCVIDRFQQKWDNKKWQD